VVPVAPDGSVAVTVTVLSPGEVAFPEVAPLLAFNFSLAGSPDKV
jgi:hypothetical protein